MATALVDKIQISQIPSVAVISNSAIVTGLVNGKNANMTTGQIADLVTKSRLNIEKVQNLSPSEMPISDSTQAALNNKLDKNGTIEQSQVNGLNTALSNKLDKNASISMDQVTGLEARLSSIENDPIPVDRIDGLEDKTNEIIDSRTDLKPQVIKGVLAW